MPLLNTRALGVIGNESGRVFSGRLDFDNSYPNGGYPIAPIIAALGLAGISDIIMGRPIGANIDAGYDFINQTIRLYVSSTGAEVGTGTDQSAFTSVPFIAFGA